MVLFKCWVICKRWFIYWSRVFDVLFKSFQTFYGYVSIITSAVEIIEISVANGIVPQVNFETHPLNTTRSPLEMTSAFYLFSTVLDIHVDSLIEAHIV